MLKMPELTGLVCFGSVWLVLGFFWFIPIRCLTLGFLEVSGC